MLSLGLWVGLALAGTIVALLPCSIGFGVWRLARGRWPGLGTMIGVTAIVAAAAVAGLLWLMRDFAPT